MKRTEPRYAGEYQATKSEFEETPANDSGYARPGKVRCSDFRFGVLVFSDLVMNISDTSQLGMSRPIPSTILTCPELHSEFITGLRRNIWHARENVVDLLPVYPLFA